MANRDAAFGLRPVRHLNGSPWNGQTRKYLIEDDYNTALFIGDPVVMEGALGADDARGIYPTIIIATAATTNPCHGVIVSFDFVGATGLAENTVYNPAYTSRYANVCVDPDVIFIMQDNAGATLTVDAIGANADYASGTGSTSTGLSAWELDAGSISQTAADNLLIVGVWPEEGNALGNWCIWEVLISCHGFTDQSGRKGI